jgi:hypothetical protein
MLAPNEHVLEYVDAYLHEALSEADRETVRRHCDECRICQAALEEAQTRAAAYRSVPTLEASEDLIRKSLVPINRPKPRTPTKAGKVFWWSVAAAAAILGIVHIFFANLSP